MFRIITVEREYGAGGSLVAAELAHRKGWQLLDQQLTGEIARMAAVDRKVVARCDEKVDPLLHRLAKVFWRGSYERALPVADHHIFDADTMVNLAHRLMAEKAREGNCVIVGRGAPYISARSSRHLPCIRVRLPRRKDQAHGTAEDERKGSHRNGRHH